MTRLEADDRLRALIICSEDSAQPVRLPADAPFVCIGGIPRTGGTTGIGLAPRPRPGAGR